jgi:UDP-glucuronate decarboxylase
MPSNSKKILVAGGAGFIGSHLCRRLLANGHYIFCLDNFYTGRKINIADLLVSKNFRLIKSDVTNAPDLKVDQIYNLACPASPPAYQKDPVFTTKTNILGALRLLEIAKKNNAKILQASTSEIYGDPLKHPQAEGYWGNVNPIGIRSCYDEGKRAAETLCMDFYRQYKTQVRITRIFNTYGPQMDPRDGRVATNFIVQALSNRPLTIYGSGKQTRSFQYVDDLIAGLILMMNNKNNFTGPVNLGNPAEFTINELADMVLSLIPQSKSKKIFKPLPSDDPKQRRPDIALAKKQLGWQPKVPLKEGLMKTIGYFNL